MLDINALNSEQYRAVTDTTGDNLLIIAGPGSGKTFTITQRIFFLIQSLNVLPEKILVVTFTKEAAVSMQERFLKSSNIVYPVNFGTFHSIFYNILRKSGAIGDRKIVSDSGKCKIIIPIISQLINDNNSYNNYNYYKSNNDNSCNKSDSNNNNKSNNDNFKNLKKIMSNDEVMQFVSAISYYKNTGDINQAKNKVSQEFQKYFEDCFKLFEIERIKRGLLDFDDMVRECRLLFQNNPELKTVWQNRFSHILIDEFQDINNEQFLTIKQLKGVHCSLFAVGDDDQAIYGFRGSNPKYMESFVKEFNAKKIFLNINYRSCEDIVESSLKVISLNKNRFVKELKANNIFDVKEKCVKLSPFIEKEDEYNYLKDILLNLSKNNCQKNYQKIIEKNREKIYEKDYEKNYEKKFETCAVLFRTNLLMQSFATLLSVLDIPFVMKEKSANIYEHFIVKDILNYILFSVYSDRELLFNIINKPLRYINREAITYADLSNIEYDIEYNNHHNNDRIFYGMKKYYLDIDNAAYKFERIKQIEKLEKDLNYLKKLSPFLAVQYVVKSIGYKKYLEDKAGTNKEKLNEWENILDWLCDEAKNYRDIFEWKKAINEYKNSFDNNKLNIKNQNIKNQNIEYNKFTVQLMTVHASKGLEFDNVYILDCNEKIFPHGNMLDEETIEEERRIFYVAMTRAKKNLELLYLTGTKKRPRLPSRFLNPLLLLD